MKIIAEFSFKRGKKSKKSNRGFLQFPSLSFNQRIRCDMVLSSLKRLRGDILDVGCGPGTSGRMLEINGSHVVYLDIDKLVLLRHLRNRDRVVADGSALPFKDRSFDFTTSVDTLEHLPKSKREAFIVELLRCAKRRVVFTFSQLHKHNPRRCGILLFELFFKLFKLPYPPWYEEHNAQAIPHLSHVKDIIRHCGFASHTKAYNGFLTVFIKGFLGASRASLRYNIDRQLPNTPAHYPLFLTILNYFIYLILSIIDTPPYYSFAVEVRLKTSEFDSARERKLLSNKKRRMVEYV